jgi:hypothetical protein
MVRVIDASHFLAGGDLPPFGSPAYAIALQVARLIEYGGPLAPRQLRPTLIPCSRRPNRKPCPGLLWVEKDDGGQIQAACPACHEVAYVISGWQGNLWSDGPIRPLDPPPDGLTH